MVSIEVPFTNDVRISLNSANSIPIGLETQDRAQHLTITTNNYQEQKKNKMEPTEELNATMLGLHHNVEGVPGDNLTSLPANAHSNKKKSRFFFGTSRRKDVRCVEIDLRYNARGCTVASFGMFAVCREDAEPHSFNSESILMPKFLL